MRNPRTRGRANVQQLLAPQRSSPSLIVRDQRLRRRRHKGTDLDPIDTMRWLALLLLMMLTWPLGLWQSFSARRRLHAHERLAQPRSGRFTLERVA
jgi:hypothetical protein